MSNLDILSIQLQQSLKSEGLCWPVAQAQTSNCPTDLPRPGIPTTIDPNQTDDCVKLKTSPPSVLRESAGVNPYVCTIRQFFLLDTSCCRYADVHG